MKHLFFCLFILGMYSVTSAQIKSVSCDELESLQLKEPRFVVIYFYTDWCSYCKNLSNTTFTKEAVISEMNANFYFIPFNAEQKTEVVFYNHTFKFIPHGINSGVHELALALGTIDDQIVYPVLCILNPKNEIVFQQKGFMDSKTLLAVLKQLLKEN